MSKTKRIAIIILLLLGHTSTFSQTDESEDIDPKVKAQKIFAELYKGALIKSDSADNLLRKTDASKREIKQNNKIASKLYSGIEKDLKTCLEINPKSYYSAYKLGLTQAKLKKYRSSIKAFTYAASLDSTQNDPYRERAMSWIARGKKDRAILDLDTAIDKNYDDFEAFYQSGYLKEVTDKKAAMSDYSRVIDLNKDYSKAYFRRALINYNDFRDYLYANQDMKKALAIDSTTIEYYYWMGKIKFNINDHEGTVKALSRYLNGDDSLNIDALVTRGASRVALNNYSGAISDFTLVLSKDKKNYVAYMNRGLAKAGLKQFKDAIIDMDMAAKIKFDFSPIYINRALVKFQMRDKDGACNDLKKADGLNNAKAEPLLREYCPK
jgi:tetratricopeptide (TPR) repeat protein